MDKSFAIKFPLNSTSLGSCSFSLLREVYKSDPNRKVPIFEIGPSDGAAQKNLGDGFEDWIKKNVSINLEEHGRENPCLTLWHINGSLESPSKEQLLYTFYELDNPTKVELNILKNQKEVFMPSDHFTDLFKDLGIKQCHTVPLAFDSVHFYEKEIKFSDDRICFGLMGKAEHRKRTYKVLAAWAKKYGNDRRYFLNCAIANNFLQPQLQEQLIGQALGGQRYWNINFINWMPSNEQYNAFLNANHIVLAMSGGESWALPEFNSVALGKHCVGLLAHGYKQWMTAENSTVIYPSGKIPAYDNIFFKQGQPFNQGNIFDWDDGEFIDACEKTIEKVRLNPINSEGRKLKDQFSWKQSMEEITKYI